MTALAVTAAVSFAFGLLLGDRRAVKQCNDILDAIMRDLFAAIGEERNALAPDADTQDDARPTVH